MCRLDTPSQGLRAEVNRLMSLHGIDLYTASMTVINYSVLVKTKLINFPKICILLILQRSGSKLFLKACYFNKETQGFWVFRKFITTAQPQKVTKCLPPQQKQLIRKISFVQHPITPAEPRKTSDISEPIASGK